MYLAAKKEMQSSSSLLYPESNPGYKPKCTREWCAPQSCLQQQHTIDHNELLQGRRGHQQAVYSTSCRGDARQVGSEIDSHAMPPSLNVLRIDALEFEREDQCVYKRKDRLALYRAAF